MDFNQLFTGTVQEIKLGLGYSIILKLIYHFLGIKRFSILILKNICAGGSLSRPPAQLICAGGRIMEIASTNDYAGRRLKDPPTQM
jgi:hypothetical protein